MAEQIGNITILHGQATAQGPDGARELAVGSPVYNNDVISTGAKSALEVEFTDGALLSQGALSKVHLDDYVFDPDTDAGEVTMNLIEGTFRSVTGKIVDMNPEGFKIETPNTTIGIRGTTTGHEVKADGSETHAVIDFVDKPVVFTSRVDGSVQIISRDGFKVESSAQGMSGIERATVRDLSAFDQLSTRSMEQAAPQGRDSGQQDGEDNPDNGDSLREEGSDGPQGGPPQDQPSQGPEGGMQGEIVDVSGGELPLAPVGGLPQGPLGMGLPLPPLPMTVPPIQGLPPMPHVIPDRPETLDDVTIDEGVTYFWGTADNDTIVGTAGKDVVHSSGGEDDLDGGNGFDFLSYANEDAGTYICFDTSTVTKYYYGKDDTFTNFEGVYGSNHADDIYASGNDEIIYGNDGDDVIWGHGGSDTLYGGDGDDKFKFHIYDQDDGTQLFGGDGTDAIKIYSSADLTCLQVVDSVEQLIFGTGNLTATFAAENIATILPSEIVGYNSTDDEVVIQTTTTATGSYDLSGSVLTDWESGDKFIFNGNSGRDKVFGTSGTDELSGHSGSDTLLGGGGNDILFGGLGVDFLTGGADNDVFKYIDTADGGDIIADFSHTDDSFTFDSSAFGGYAGTLDPGHFFTSAGAVTGTDACFYTDADILYYDSDGIGTDTAVAIATCTGAGGSIDNTDITFS